MADFRSRNDLNAETRNHVVALLNQHLADTFDLYSQVKEAHWNVRGPLFISLHKLFDELAEILEVSIDEIAERATALGGRARGTARMAAQKSRLPEYPLELTDGLAHVNALSDRYAALAKHVRTAIDQTAEWGDAGTSDLLTGLVRELDKSLWFLEAHLQGS